MRKILIGLGAALCLVPTTAQAGGYTVQQEGTVKVYRGKPAQISPYAVRNCKKRQYKAEQARAQQLQVQAQNREIDRQAAEIRALKHDIDHLEERLERPRPRYGRSYYGNPRFFGVNGFIGNRNFAGATVRLPKRRH